MVKNSSDCQAAKNESDGFGEAGSSTQNSVAPMIGCSRFLRAISVSRISFPFP